MLRGETVEGSNMANQDSKECDHQVYVRSAHANELQTLQGKSGANFFLCCFIVSEGNATCPTNSHQCGVGYEMLPPVMSLRHR